MRTPGLQKAVQLAKCSANPNRKVLGAGRRSSQARIGLGARRLVARCAAGNLVTGSARMLNLWSLITRLACVVATLPLGSSPAQAQLHVIMSGGFSAAYRQALPQFERTTGIAVTTASGASQGTGPQTIAARLQRGVPADVAILSREGLAELISAGWI